MTEPSTSPSNTPSPTAELPDRLCTWCKVAMTKRLVAGGQFIHYTCPKCVFQHTTKRAPK
ncbi:MAG: hypothetical protein KIT40_10235 [Nitrospira sp.]|nr:hypothetical protein [Nitrospira sp.]